MAVHPSATCVLRAPAQDRGLQRRTKSLNWWTSQISRRYVHYYF